jgi:hypothetical protein
LTGRTEPEARRASAGLRHFVVGQGHGAQAGCAPRVLAGGNAGGGTVARPAYPMGRCVMMPEITAGLLRGAARLNAPV